jgi:hypothetical protein
MSITAKRVVAVALGLTAISVGAWAAAAPRSFFTSFPLPGHHWVAAEPPYNEHLTRDVGGLYLALFVVSIWAAVRPRQEMFAMAGLAWEAFSLPHLVFHTMHLDTLSTGDAVANVVALGTTVLLAALLLAPARKTTDSLLPTGNGTARTTDVRQAARPVRTYAMNEDQQ